MDTTSRIVNHTNIITTGGVHKTSTRQPELRRFIDTCLNRHLHGDWGDLDQHDIETNNQAIRHRSRLLSSYQLPQPIEVTTNYGPATEDNIWIITDAGWATTTILWPSEY